MCHSFSSIGEGRGGVVMSLPGMDSTSPLQSSHPCTASLAAQHVLPAQHPPPPGQHPPCTTASLDSTSPLYSTSSLDITFPCTTPTPAQHHLSQTTSEQYTCYCNAFLLYQTSNIFISYASSVICEWFYKCMCLMWGRSKSIL